MELKDTIQGMTSEDYKERLKAEYNQLVIRSRKLRNIIEDHKNGKLKIELSCPIEVLEDQYKIMVIYAGLLVKRAKLYEDIKLEEV